MSTLTTEAGTRDATHRRRADGRRDEGLRQGPGPTQWQSWSARPLTVHRSWMLPRTEQLRAVVTRQRAAPQSRASRPQCGRGG